MKFLLSINYLYWLLLSALFFAAGEFWSKKFALTPRPSYVVLAVAIYSLGVLAWLPAILQKNSLAIVGTIWSVMSLLATILIGVLIFSEKISLIGIAGVITAIIAIILLSIG
jgi:multidrug transporter EmrE-like cation transporter